MCGIAGIIDLEGKPADKLLLEKMIKIQSHRGPDGQGFWSEENVGLGHCRLSIIDLSSAGHQPMSNEDGSFVIVHNGEVYNYLELRRDLEQRGYVFKSNTDTEVILYSFKEYGDNCLSKFNGMWAFAIWNTRKRELFCSRDHFGIKPFYYYLDKKTFAFASEIKSLLEMGILREANDELIYDFLRFGLLDHTNETFFKNIKKLPPGFWLRINPNGEMAIERYWDFDVSDEINDDKRNSQGYAEEFLELFIDSIRLRLRSDVAIGSCLSGGLDSSSVVSVVNHLLKKEEIPNIGKRQKTFSSCFEDRLFDEREYIEEIIKNTGVEKNYIFPEPEEFLKELGGLLWHQEEPFAGTSIYAQWSVIKRAKEKVKVLLDGQGGDEILCGYRKFYIFYLRKLLNKHRYLLFINELIRFFSSISILRTLNVRKGFRYSKLVDRLLGIEGLFNPEFLKNFQERECGFGYQEDIGKRLKEDITTWSLPVLLRYEDKNSMAHSVEARLPFLDHRLVEKAASIPINQKMRNGWTKVILREAMEDILPEKIRLRKSKLGFVTPEDLWFKIVLNKDIKSIIRNSHLLSSYVNKERLLSEFENFLAGRNLQSANLFFRFYILELWGRRFL